MLSHRERRLLKIELACQRVKSPRARWSVRLRSCILLGLVLTLSLVSRTVDTSNLISLSVQLYLRMTCVLTVCGLQEPLADAGGTLAEATRNHAMTNINHTCM
jgi:hypothetical protein